MTRIDELENATWALYEAKHPNRADWADYLFEHHVLIVAQYASKLAEKYKANAELSRAGALLHDIADATMPRSDPNHERYSLEAARSMMGAANYSPDEIALVVDDAIRYHSCHNGEQPTTLEGKVLSTADSCAHLKTDFYLFAVRAFSDNKQFGATKDWVLKKLERDLYNKVFFDDEREELTKDYVMLKELFSR